MKKVSNPNGENNRKYPRKAFRKAVSFMTEGKSSTGSGVEIGEGGLSFVSEIKIDVSKKIIMNFFLSDKDFFSVRVTLLNVVNSSRSFTYGVKFDDVSCVAKLILQVNNKSLSLIRYY